MKYKISLSCFAICITLFESSAFPTSFILHNKKLSSSQVCHTGNDKPTLFELVLNQNSGSKYDEENVNSQRRSFLEGVALVIASSFSSPLAATAADSAASSSSTSSTTDVRAPIEYLLPATRVRIYIDTLVDKAKLAPEDPVALKTLENLLLEPPIFISQQETIQSKTALKNENKNKGRPVQTLNTALLQQQEQKDPFSSSSNPLTMLLSDPGTAASTALQQWGMKRQYSILQRRQSALERSNNMRAALNTYTNHLAFDAENYRLNVDTMEKKRMVRNNALPNVKSVIKSDLDLRDLYRNQMLTTIDDARAELEYQLSRQQKDNLFDGTELLALLQEAQKSCRDWFQFIPEQDVKEALLQVSAQ